MSQKIIVGVVDDCEMYSMSLCLNLKRLKGIELYSFTTKSAGHDVLDWLETIPCLDILIVDILINGINGLEIADCTLSRFPDCEIIILTGCSEDNDMFHKASMMANNKDKITLKRKSDGTVFNRVLPQVYVANRVTQLVKANKKGPSCDTGNVC